MGAVAALEKPRRIAAVVLPELLVELASEALFRGKDPAKRARQQPLGVLLVATEAAAEGDDELAASARLDAVNREARRFGVREGQTIAEASALVAGLVVKRVALSAVQRALSAVAEAALGFGATVAIGDPDTIWVEIGGSAHLFGGETALCSDLVSRVRAMGHAVRVAVSSGPTVAQMFARWAQPKATGRGEPGVFVIASERTPSAMADLPVIALPLGAEIRDWLVRLGVLTVGELAKLPRSSLGPRLEADAARVLELAAGRDPAPLTAFQPPRTLLEAMSWEHEASGNEPLLFALRGLSARISARLSGRGEAAQSLVLTIEHAGAFARFRNTESVTKLRFALSTPLWREEQIHRVVASRLERVKLQAPSVGLKLEVPVLSPAVARQLDFGELLCGNQGAVEELPLILAELVADIGEDRVGVLKLVDSHRPEAQSVLAPVQLRETGSAHGAQTAQPRLRKAPPRRLPGAPTRLLPEPLPLEGPLYVGAALALSGRLYSVERIVFEHRLDGVEWWSRSPVARDYVRLLLRGGEGFLEALAFVERRSQKAFLQAIAD